MTDNLVNLIGMIDYNMLTKFTSEIKNIDDKHFQKAGIEVKNILDSDGSNPELNKIIDKIFSNMVDELKHGEVDKNYPLTSIMKILESIAIKMSKDTSIDFSKIHKKDVLEKTLGFVSKIKNPLGNTEEKSNIVEETEKDIDGNTTKKRKLN